jgi:hypothetical protein
MRRIIIDVYDHTSNDEVEDVLDALRAVGVDPRLETVSDRHVQPLATPAIRASEKVWLGKKTGSPVTLHASESEALWGRILSDSIASRAFTGPRT